MFFKDTHFIEPNESWIAGTPPIRMGAYEICGLGGGWGTERQK